MPGVKSVPPCGVCMVGRFFVKSALMMLSCFTVVTRGMCMAFCRLLVVLGCFFRHAITPLVDRTPRETPIMVTGAKSTLNHHPVQPQRKF